MSAGKLPLNQAADPVPGTEDDKEMNNSIADHDGASTILDARIQAQLGLKLSAYYTDLVNQPIPDTFLDLLKKLERAEKGE